MQGRSASSPFREKTLNPREGVVLYTALPPPRGRPRGDLKISVESVLRLLEEAPVDAVHIPEVREEADRPGGRPIPFTPKVEPRVFGRLLQQSACGRFEVVISRRVVYTHWANQRRWLLRTRREYGIRNLLLVGGESSRTRYPGPPVVQAAERIRRELPAEGADYFLGGIAIPTRPGEADRLVAKAQSGIEFFTSQILYEAEGIKELLRAYDRRCRELGTKPRRVFLSFAPISGERDLEFLRWMGVHIPPRVEREILRGWLGTAWRSVVVCARILRDVLTFHREEELDVPLGINVEHALRHNFEISRDLALALWEVHRSYRAAG